jgi:MFS family permease
MNKKLFWIYVLSSAVYFTQGIEGVPGLALFFYLKEKLHLNASTIMYLSTLTTLAWLIKPIWGYLCDNYMTKKSWIIFSLLGSLVTCLVLGLSPIIPLFALIPLLMFDDWNTAVRDVATDGIMCVEGKETNTCDKIQSIQWMSITVASIIVGLAGGYIADHWNYHIGYLALLPIYLIIIGIVFKYKTTVQKNRTKSKLLESICSYKELFTNKQFLLGALFIFVYNFAPGFGTPLMFIERDSFHWSGTFMGIIGALSSVVSIVGAMIYYKISKKINVKKCLFWSVFFVGLTNLCYLYFTPTSAIIYSLIFGFLGMFIFLNMMTFMANSTLPGKEATSFALLCSVNNLSGSLSTLTGAWLFPLIGLKTIIILATLSAFLSLPILKKLEIK